MFTFSLKDMKKAPVFFPISQVLRVFKDSYVIEENLTTSLNQKLSWIGTLLRSIFKRAFLQNRCSKIGG